MIELSDLEEMFENIQSNTGWDMNKPMLWGYFFTDPSREKLQEAAAVLENAGYRFVDLYVPELEDDEDEYFFLHMEREEAHSPQTLNERNMQLYAFAEKHELDSYDGMDVGPIQP
ncbi:ribonuclease E inhibitor RraB [Thiobacillus sedimenti]|uniref:Ribonuclease E inhibitor RraB n=1 Tax=Thiobacillus sedimenti TaxID=3110231 RepID=A0ABZ1CMF0_9PROT|nr:ribonuclease E inhibitor RraB [Thiobacillus sp. SCUT-2]WRS40462.1 ribonuclease E inhibitor RraB [Thiobacillus sp. SCUT-2]